MTGPARLGVDIGGTFTDVAMERGDELFTTKVLTTHKSPEEGVLQAVDQIVRQSGTALKDIQLIVHGTTLITNALIERKGAKTAFVTTEGFRDVLEMRIEDRYDQYNLWLDLPTPLVPRRLRYVVSERVNGRGEVLIPLDEKQLLGICEQLRQQKVEVVVIGFLHSYVNPSHEQRAAEIIAKEIPGVALTLSSDVCPEMREYDRFSTACANGYVQPIMRKYLHRLDAAFRDRGFLGPLLLMSSGGGLTTIENAVKYPVRLVESGPAGGAVFSSVIAEQCGIENALSFDMGGTTAKICLIKDARPQTARAFEAARLHRFKKGSGLPLRIPVIEMVEIGAGGGSIARVDLLQRIAVGPESAGSEPGPVSYARGGTEPTVTDANLVLGYIDADDFSGGAMKLDKDAASNAIRRTVAEPLKLPVMAAASGVTQIVEEAMSSAARVHAIESGKDASNHTIIAFGGGAPLHAASVAEKLGISRFIIPRSAGVGSAVGFLRAPASYEVVRSDYHRLHSFDLKKANRVFAEMEAEASKVVAAAAPGVKVEIIRHAQMRYVGQGHEISVPVSTGTLTIGDIEALKKNFDAEYRRLFSREVPRVEAEVLSWIVLVRAMVAPPTKILDAAIRRCPAKANSRRLVFNPETGDQHEIPVFQRNALEPGNVISGPAIIVESETSTVIGANFEVVIDAYGYIDARRRAAMNSESRPS